MSSFTDSVHFEPGIHHFILAFSQGLHCGDYVWDFHSLLIGLQMMFSFMLAEDKTPLRMCDHCDTIFIAKRKNQYFCSDKCRRKGE